MLTSSPLPAGTPDHVTAGLTGPGLSPAAASPMPLTLLRAGRTFPDGSAELVYAPA